jgi:hypothetical protein
MLNQRVISIEQNSISYSGIHIFANASEGASGQPETISPSVGMERRG